MKLAADVLFPLLADTTRLRILLLLLQESELCVCELTGALQLSQPKISRHLALLRESGLLSTRRSGVWMYYRPEPSLPAWARDVMTHTLDGNRLVQPFSGDLKRLNRMSNRPAAACCT